MAEPTLSDISSLNTDPQLSGIAANPVIDNSKSVELLNQNARYNSENTWRKYNQFLENKKDLFKNIGDIQSLDTAPQDKDLLNKQAGDIFKDILNDPSAVMGGRGYSELQQKIGKYRQDSVLSKQNKLDDDANELFMNRNPELYTDENKAKRENFWKAPLGSRESVMLSMPSVFDESAAFNGIKTAATQPYTSIVGADGKPGQGYIETGNEINPKAIGGLWNMLLKGEKDKYGHSILGAVQDNYNKLPPEIKSKYDAANGGGIEQYFKDRGNQYLDAYFPQGSYEVSPNGNYRFGKTLKPDPNYLGRERLNQQEANDAANLNLKKQDLAVKWANYGLAKNKIDNANGDDLAGADTVLNEAMSTIKNGTPVMVSHPNGIQEHLLRISDPTLLQKFGNVDKDGNVANVPDGLNYNPKNDQVTLLYYGKNNKTGGVNYDKEIPMEGRTWLKLITSRSFPNKDIGGVNSLIEGALQKNGGSLYKLTQGSTPSAPEVKPKSVPATNTIKIGGFDLPKIK